MIKKNILIDIDGTVSEDIPNEESHRFKDACVLDGAVLSVNKLYNDGHIITFFTARKEIDRQITIDWLDNNGFKYHQLLMNKPRGGNYIWIDNLNVEGIHYKDNWGKVLSDIMNNKNNIETDLNTSL
tara:strand:+ start:5552 stop:5932 length:381 start_codon:yes stop_codon:yes gene_type:complete